MRAGAALVGCLALLLAACGSDGAGPVTTPPPPSGPVTTVTTVEALATYSRSGGLAGRRFEVVVRPDGTFAGGAASVGRGQLGAAALEELQRLVDAFVAARPAATYGQPAADGFTTEVAARGTSTTLLTGGDPPSWVQQLVGFLAGLERQLPR